MKTATEVEAEGVLQDARQVALQVIERLQGGARSQDLGSPRSYAPFGPDFQCHRCQVRHQLLRHFQVVRRPRRGRRRLRLEGEHQRYEGAQTSAWCVVDRQARQVPSDRPDDVVVAVKPRRDLTSRGKTLGY